MALIPVPLADQPDLITLNLIRRWRRWNTLTLHQIHIIIAIFFVLCFLPYFLRCSSTTNHCLLPQMYCRIRVKLLYFRWIQGDSHQVSDRIISEMVSPICFEHCLQQRKSSHIQRSVLELIATNQPIPKRLLHCCQIQC